MIENRYYRSHTTRRLFCINYSINKCFSNFLVLQGYPFISRSIHRDNRTQLNAFNVSGRSIVALTGLKPARIVKPSLLLMSRDMNC